MAFVVEPGTGSATATSYASEAAADSYHTDRGNAAWAAALSGAKQTALIRATEAIDRLWFGQFRGTKLLETQALEWPRSDAYDRNAFALTGVPVALVRATCEAALIELGEPGALTPEQERGGAIKEENVAGAVKIVYQDWAAGSTQYTALNQAIQPLLSSGGGSLSVFRV